MADPTVWLLCAVRMIPPDPSGRLAVTEVVPLNLAMVGKVAEATGGAGVLEGTQALTQGLPDGPEVRAALGLPPRLKLSDLRRKKAEQEAEATAKTGVAGVGE